jgi:hypothetical protein
MRKGCYICRVRFSTELRRAALATLLACSCTQKSQPPTSVTPAVVPPQQVAAKEAPSPEEREELFRVERAAPWGDELPKTSRSVRIEADRVLVDNVEVSRRASGWAERVVKLIEARPCSALVDSDPERYLADVSELLAALAASDCEVWLRHPEAPLAFKLRLLDNAQFERWLSEPQPGRIRVIQRADGFELQTNMGKLAGPDPNGPTVPTRGGQLDIARLRSALLRVKERFSSAPDACLVPSFGTELPAIAKAFSGFYRAPSERILEQLCLVYPAPVATRGGGDR